MNVNIQFQAFIVPQISTFIQTDGLGLGSWSRIYIPNMVCKRFLLPVTHFASNIEYLITILVTGIVMTL